jgi:hypothetical protein
LPFREVPQTPPRYKDTIRPKTIKHFKESFKYKGVEDKGRRPMERRQKTRQRKAVVWLPMIAPDDKKSTLSLPLLQSPVNQTPE